MDPSTDGEALVARLAGLGPFFAVSLHHPEEAPRAPWRRLSELVASPAVVRRRTDGARAALAATARRPVEQVELAVAASVVHLGLAARLVSPLLALAAAGAGQPVPTTHSIWWQDVGGGAMPISVPLAVVERAGRRDADSAWAGDVVTRLAEVSQAFAPLVPSLHVRRGNVASAVSGALTMLAGAAPGRLPGDDVPRARALAELLLTQPWLRSAAAGAPGTAAFRRRSCCLIYRASTEPPRAVCGDCVLLDR